MDGQERAAPSPSPSSSSDSEPHRRQPPAQAEPADPPKIPPPPTEHPPPYTPFCGQSSALLPPGPQQSPERAAAARARVSHRLVVDPPGWRRHLRRHLTARNLLAAGALFVGLCVFAYFIHWANKSDEGLEHGPGPLEEHHRALSFSHRSLGAVKGKRDRISFDAAADTVILSAFEPERGILRADTVQLGDHLGGFKQSWFDASANGENNAFDDCARFTDKLVCCSTPGYSHRHLTKCFLRAGESTEHGARNVTSVASMFDFLPRWQSLDDGEALLLVQNRQEQAVLDLRRNILHRIEQSSLPSGYHSHGFHFPRNTADELAELVRDGDQFRICDYVRTRQVDQEHGNYALKDPKCRETPFTAEFELPRVLFCENSFYAAVVQYGPSPGEQSTLTWRLRVHPLKFHSSSSLVYSTGESVQSTHAQVLVMDCAEKVLNLFVLGDHELHQFMVRLPALGNEHFG